MITGLGELEPFCAWARSEDGQERHRILKEDLRRPQDPTMTALIFGALISLERLKYYNSSGICQSAAKTFPDFEFLFHESPSTSQAALESMAYVFRTVAWALLDQWEVERIDELLSMPLSHTEHMTVHTETMTVYWTIRLGSSWSHRYALIWTKFEAIPQVKTSRVMLEKLKARSRAMLERLRTRTWARKGRRAIGSLFFVLIWILLLWLAV